MPGVGAVETDTLPETGPDDRLTMVTAPELLQLSGFAVWNGRQTVPGVWAAHPGVTKPMDARVIDSASGRHVDVRLFRAEARGNGDEITLSFEAARALGLEAGRRSTLSLVALVPGNLGVKRERRSAERTARSALAGFAASLDHDRLAELVGALMRGMGYRTEFTGGHSEVGAGTAIRAVPGAGPAISIALRAGGGDAINQTELGAFGRSVRDAGGIGLVVSVPGFARDARQGRLAGGAFVQTMDLAALLDLWVRHYPDMAPDDRALLPLKPVYFLAAN